VKLVDYRRESIRRLSLYGFYVCKKQNHCVDVVQKLLLTISWHYEDCNSTMKAKYFQMKRPRDSSLVT
jgi:hypothetical protein